MKTVKLKRHYLSIIIYMFVLNILMPVHAEQKKPGVERLQAGIESYESGKYLNAIINLEAALTELPQDDKENLWDAHFYLGLSYLLLGDADELRKEFNKAKEIFKKRLPDTDIYSPKIIKLFEKALRKREPVAQGIYTDSVTSMEFVLVKGGCFDMGNPSSKKWSWEEDEKPLHEVCLDDFYIGKYEITQGQWEEVMGNNPSSYKSGNNYPVHDVSWDDVQEFIKKLNQKIGRNYRLPTEAEWEYASKSGGKREEWAGTSNEKELGKYAWYVENSNRDAHPVGQKKPNGLGIYDMIGNVNEWCQDVYSSKAYKKHQRNNPIYTKSDYIIPRFTLYGFRKLGRRRQRVVRGGEYTLPSSSMSTFNRHQRFPDYRNVFTGFRLARTP